MPNLQYIGARYVPIVYNNPDDGSSDWKSGEAYEALTIVTYLSNSYTSRKPVPATVGNPQDNPDYWSKTGDYNAALVNLTNMINSAQAEIDGIKACYINALDLGFKNDGTTDNSPLMNTIFGGNDYEGAIIYFPRGIYRLASRVEITKKIAVVGDPATVFMAGAAMDYLFHVDYDQYSYWDRSIGNIFTGVTFDGNDIAGGIAFDEYLDVTIENCKFKNIPTYGINTRLDSSSNGVQMHVKNVRFYNDAINTATAIYDNGSDNYYDDILVCNYKVAIRAGAAVITNIHAWLSIAAMFSGSVVVQSAGNNEINSIHVDTIETGVEIVGDLNQPYHYIGSFIYANNNNINPSGIPTAIKFGTYDAANVKVDSMILRFGLAHVADITNPKNLVIDTYFSFNNTGADRDYLLGSGGDWHGGRGTTMVKSGSINDLYRAGTYVFSSQFPLSDLPAGVGGDGTIIVKSRGTANDCLQVIYSSATLFIRTMYNGAGTWRKVALTNA